MSRKHKIAFLFLDEIHHLYHFISVAVALSEKHDVSILTYPAKHKLLYNTLKKLKGEKVKVEQLKTNWFRALTDKVKNRTLPRKGFWIKKNMHHLLNDFDAVVFTDFYHHKLLKARKNNVFPKLINIMHGAPGRAYSYKKDLLDFDFQILFGDFHKKQLEEQKVLVESYSIVGYSKFDVVNLKKKKKFFKNDNTTVLYNPHFTENVTSWYKNGLEVLEFFYTHKEYNLIFAPHVNLFTDKGGENINDIPKKYFEAKNIKIDVGSKKSINMNYVKSADMYLGDVSSQVYEFIINPRPCIFINSHKVVYQDDLNYRFWQCGEVIENISELSEAISSSKEKFESVYRDKQTEISNENFYTDEDSTASERAAQAISKYLDNVSETK